jgi:HEAT repeat protein
MRIHRPGSAEHDSCKRLLVTLGGHTIGPLLEVLADEPDMAARKALVDLISGIATGHVTVLAERIADPRWYFVRNVVSILGSTRSPDVLPYLNRTLRHVDSRVRRETIRAASSIRERMAEEMLTAALADDDPQNVGLAARYLGNLGSRGTLAALVMVARGEGRGNRDIGPRVEAIEALGRIGSPDAVAALRDLAHERGGIIRTGRAREIRTAADAALAEIDRVRREGGA